LDCVVSCIDGSKHQLLLLDEEIESQFDKMFKVEKNVRNIGEIASICRGASPRPISQFITDEPSGVNWIKIGDVETNAIYITKTAEKITQEAAKKSRFVKPGDFILSNSMSFGRPYILKIAGCVHDGWLILSNYQNMLLPLYFYYALRSNFVQEQFERNAAGSTVRNLNSNIVRKCKVIVPPMESQIVFSSFVDKAEKAKSDIRIKEALFEELFANRCHQFFETEA
jgi:type I restriction enzyme S subunit